MAYYFKPKHAAWFVTNNSAGVYQIKETERAVASLWTTISERKTIVIAHSLFFVSILPLVTYWN